MSSADSANQFTPSSRIHFTWACTYKNYDAFGTRTRQYEFIYMIYTPVIVNLSSKISCIIPVITTPIISTARLYN